MTEVIVNLRTRDGVLIKTIEMRTGWYVPPQLVIDGDNYYIRTSPDTVYSPLEFQIVEGVFRADD
jgi:hypothetical protein